MLLKYLSAFEKVLHSWGKAHLLGFNKRPVSCLVNSILINA